jgi:hypothetical protein
MDRAGTADTASARLHHEPGHLGGTAPRRQQRVVVCVAEVVVARDVRILQVDAERQVGGLFDAFISALPG